MSLLPDECAIAFKEWSEICQVLADGRQSLIVRKGGIHEGPGGFLPEHRAFWLYPTYVHQAQQGLREIGADLRSEPQAPTDTVSIRALAVVVCLWHVRSHDELPALAPFHYWTDETLSKIPIPPCRPLGAWRTHVSPGRALVAHTDRRAARMQELGDPELTRFHRSAPAQPR